MLDNGQTVFVDYAADRCSTRARQARIIQASMASNPAYAQNVAFVRVDWDTYRRAEANTSRRSALLVLKGNRELGRIVVGTWKTDIQALMDVALAAATTS